MNALTGNIKKKLVAENSNSSHVFKMSLNQLHKVAVYLKEEEEVMAEIPEFIHEACSAIAANIQVEGIFRKGGSASKQKHLKELIDSGKGLPSSCHVVDVCNLVKLFLRELPEPIISDCYHETMLSCLLLPGEGNQREALLLSCLLLPRENITVLSYLLEFLNKVAQNSLENKMDARNLAIVITPSLMHIDKKFKLGNSFNMNHHISLVEILILNAKDVGRVPKNLVDTRVREKRRSASITKMFSGIKKMVGRGSSPPRDSPIGAHNRTSLISPIGTKRKSQEILPPAVTIKRRKEMADTTPRMCRMRAYSTGSLEQNEQKTEHKPARTEGLKGSRSSSNLIISKKRLERKFSSIAWGKRRKSLQNNVSTIVAPTPSNSTTSDEAVVTIPRQEYEDMLSKVVYIEKMLKNQNTTENEADSSHLAMQLEKDLNLGQGKKTEFDIVKASSTMSTNIEAAFQKTIEQSELLAPELRKDVRLRWSSERVVRSPSERKIGTIRRRSRELSEDLKTKRSASASAISTLRNPKSGYSRNSVEDNEHWQPATTVLASKQLSRVRGSPRKRDSISSLRRNNHGMVQAKAKFFDSLNHSTENESDRSSELMERRLQCVHNEMRQIKEKQRQPPIIKAPLMTPAAASYQLRTPRSCIGSTSLSRSRSAALKALPDCVSVNTPFRSTRRSPRILARAKSLRSPSVLSVS